MKDRTHVTRADDVDVFPVFRGHWLGQRKVRIAHRRRQPPHVGTQLLVSAIVVSVRLHTVTSAVPGVCSEDRASCMGMRKAIDARYVEVIPIKQ